MGVPVYSTFWWTFVLLDPDALNSCFINWVQALTKNKLGQHIAIDGKALRGTKNGVIFWAEDVLDFRLPNTDLL